MKHLTLLNGIKTITTATLLVVAVIVGIQHTERTSATIADNVTGHLWSDAPNGSDEMMGCAGTLHCGRGFGWISLNSVTETSGAPYGVKLDPVTGRFSGHGWSEHAGWVDFNPAGPFPTGPGTTPQAAYVDSACLIARGTACNTGGWIRFIAGATTPFGGMDDGWDGWVSLKGTGYGVKLNAQMGEFSEKAWGDVQAGWISFADAKVALPPPDQDPDPEMCYDLNNVGYPYMLGDPIPQQCKSFACTDAISGNTIYYPVNATYPTQCIDDPEPPYPLICQDPQGVVYVYASGSPMPDECMTDPDDVCSILGGDQTGEGPWQDSNGIYYGLVNTTACIVDQCLDTSDPETQGFQAFVPFSVTASNGTTVTYVVDASDNVCKKQTLIVCTKPNPADCVVPSKPLNPIIKEN